MPKINSKAKGNTFEREIAKELRERFGWDVVTSRSESKRMDDACVDLMGIPLFSLQLKAWEKSPPLHDTLQSMPDDTNINCVFWKKNRKGTVVVMEKDDFYAIVSMLKMNGIL